MNKNEWIWNVILFSCQGVEYDDDFGFVIQSPFKEFHPRHECLFVLRALARQRNSVQMMS